MKLIEQTSPLMVVGKGALAGLVGTAVISVGMTKLPQLMQQLGVMPPPSNKDSGPGPTEELAERVAEGVLETSIDSETREVAGQTIHWAYGTFWGMLYGLIQSSLHLPHHLHGLVLGGLTGAVSSTLLPAMGLTPPPAKQPTSMNAMQLGLHFLYGWVTAMAFDSISSES